MSKTNAFETDFSELVFNDVALAGIGDASGLQGDPASAGTLEVGLFATATPPTESTPGTEVSYTTYARVAVARSALGWTVAADNTSNAAAVQFPNCTAGSAAANYVGVFASGGTTLLYYGQLDSSLSISVGVQPQFAIGALDINEN